MRGLAQWFFVSGIVYLLAGMLLGIHMGISQDHSLMPAHAHLNLIGGALMALFGLYYHAVPAAAESRLARFHFWAATLAIWVITPGIALVHLGHSDGLAVAGSLITFAAALLFLVITLRAGRVSA